MASMSGSTKTSCLIGSQWVLIGKIPPRRAGQPMHGLHVHALISGSLQFGQCGHGNDQDSQESPVRVWAKSCQRVLGQNSNHVSLPDLFGQVFGRRRCGHADKGGRHPRDVLAITFMPALYLKRLLSQIVPVLRCGKNRPTLQRRCLQLGHRRQRQLNTPAPQAFGTCAVLKCVPGAASMPGR